MLTANDIKRLSFDVEEEFQELDTPKRVYDAAEAQYEVLDRRAPKGLPNGNSRDTLRSGFDPDTLQNSEIKSIIEDSFNELGGKHNISVNFKDFTEIASHLGEYSDKDSEFAKLYVSKMINAVTDVAKTKATISLGYLTDRALTLAMQRAQDPNINDLGEIVAVIREIYDWLDKLQDLRDKYNIVGADKLMTKMSDATEDDNKPKLSVAALKDIVNQINKNADSEEKT